MKKLILGLFIASMLLFSNSYAQEPVDTITSNLEVVAVYKFICDMQGMPAIWYLFIDLANVTDTAFVADQAKRVTPPMPFSIPMELYLYPGFIMYADMIGITITMDQMLAAEEIPVEICPGNEKTMETYTVLREAAAENDSAN